MYTAPAPVIYTIIVTYNGAQWIRQCLSALAHSSVHEFTIVVDNASTDDTVHIINTEFPYIELLQNKSNAGFGAANNNAIKIALARGAQYLLLLNQDAYVATNTLDQLLQAAQAHPQYGIISPVQLNGSGEALDVKFKKYLQRACSNEDLEKLEKKTYNGEVLVAVRFVNAAAWLVQASVCKKAGLFHPIFYHYGEDNNFSSRAQYHGFKVGICTRSYVVHDRSQRTADKQHELVRKIKTIVRYTATDLRKSFGVAYVLALWKYMGLYLKSMALRNSTIQQALRDEWVFLKSIIAIKTYRKDMKNPML